MASFHLDQQETVIARFINGDYVWLGGKDLDDEDNIYYIGNNRVYDSGSQDLYVYFDNHVYRPKLTGQDGGRRVHYKCPSCGDESSFTDK